MRVLEQWRRSGRQAGRQSARALALAAAIVVALGVSETASAKDKLNVKAKIENGTLMITGTGEGDTLALRLLADDATTLEIDVGNNGSADLDFKRDKFVRVLVNTGDGDDSVRVDESNGVFTDTEETTQDGGAGADSVHGGAGDELFLGGTENDTIDGNGGDDIALLGAGDDRFQWDPGDGSDTIEGQDGIDRMLFNGSAGSEIFEASANGARLRFTRNLGNIVMDTDDVEVVDLNALGGTDTLTVNDLSGTDVVDVDSDLAGTIGGTAGDAAQDVVIVNGVNGADTIDVVGARTSASVIGLAARVNIANSEGANDSLVINALGGDDAVTATMLLAGAIKLTVDGAAGEDDLLGSQGADVFLGGDADDFIFGDNGDDVAFMGAGDDAFRWNPGDGSDSLEGQDGADSMLFFGANIAENIDIAANGGRVLFVRDVANVTMDFDDVETIDFRALGGADNIVVGDLTGTDVTQNGLDLRGPNGGGDGAADTVTVNGTQGDDTFGAAGDAGGVNVFGLQAAVDVSFQERANDRLKLDALGGDDVVDATSLQADGIQLTMNGGLGADAFLGSEGDDLIRGGDGSDLALMGAGDDTFAWNPGDDNDTLEGQAGADTTLFSGSDAPENIDISASGGRVVFFRDVATVTMDLDDVERIDFRALGAPDTIVVHDLGGTDLSEVNTDLAAAGGGGDAQPDTVIVHGTNGDDVSIVAGDASGVAVIGLAAQVNITGAEAVSDRLTVNALGGDDVVEASGLAASAIQLVAEGGAGDDVLIGGDGNDVLSGGPDDDTLVGGPGNDIIDGGDGDDIEINGLGADTVTSVTAAGKDWLTTHARTADCKIVLKIGGNERTLPRADLSQLIRDATSP